MAEPVSRLAVVRHFLLLSILSSVSRIASIRTPESSIDSAVMAAETYNKAGGPQNVDLTLDFVHIHKAFGTNFLFTMMPIMCPERRGVNDKMDNIPTEACYMYPKFESKEEMSEITSGKRFKFVSSEKLSDFIYWTPGIVKAIVFRDPIDRAISSFEYEQWHEKKVDPSKSLKDYVLHGTKEERVPYVHNWQTVVVLGSGYGDPVLEAMAKRVHRMDFHGGRCFLPEEVEALKKLLWRYEFIGIGEHMAISNCLFAKTFSPEYVSKFCDPVPLEEDTVVSSVNARPTWWEKHKYPADAYKELVRANTCDIQLYSIAMEIFWDRILVLL